MDESIGLGLDLGGSSVKIAVLKFLPSRLPEVMTTATRETHPSRTPGLVFDELAEITHEFRESHGPFDSIGFAMPGIHDKITGKSTHMPNFPKEWQGYPVHSEIEARLGQRVRLTNDCRAFSLAESVLGAGRNFNNVVCIVLGTGIGGGIVLNGKVWSGSGVAGEIGHQSVDLDGPLCGCGNRGCVEAIAGSAAIISAGGRASVKEVFAAAARGEERARQAVDRAVCALAAGLANAYAFVAPDAIVIGGGIAEAGEQLIDPLITQIRERTRMYPNIEIRLLRAELGIFAGAVGAAMHGALTD